MTAAAVAAIIFGITFGITFGLSGAASAQQPAAPAAQSPAPPQRDFSKTEIKTTDLGHDTYMLQGEGGNMTIAVGADGVIMVDSEFAPLHDRIKAAIDKITKQPIKFLEKNSTRLMDCCQNSLPIIGQLPQEGNNSP